MKLFHESLKGEPFLPYYKRNFGKLEGPWPPIINALLALMSRLEAEIDGPVLICSTSHEAVCLSRPDVTDGFVCWLTYGLTAVNGEGRYKDVPAYFIEDHNRVVHRAEIVEAAILIIVVLMQRCDEKRELGADTS